MQNNRKTSIIILKFKSTKTMIYNFILFQVFFKMNDMGHGKLMELRDIAKANRSLTVSRLVRIVNGLIKCSN